MASRLYRPLRRVLQKAKSSLRREARVAGAQEALGAGPGEVPVAVRVGVCVAGPGEALVVVRVAGPAEAPVVVFAGVRVAGLAEARVAVCAGEPGGHTVGAGGAGGIAAAVAGISGRRGSGPTPTSAATTPATAAAVQMVTAVPTAGTSVPGDEELRTRLGPRESVFACNVLIGLAWDRRETCVLSSWRISCCAPHSTRSGQATAARS